MKNNLIRKFQCIETAGLFILAFSLPVFDAPTHIGYGLLVLGAAGWRILDKKIKLRKPSFIETLIIIILSISLISTIINWPLHYGIKGFKHYFYFFSTFWILSKGKYNSSIIKTTIILLVAGAVAADIAGFWKFCQLSSHSDITEFNLLSLNGIDRSAAYVSIIIFVCIGIVFDDCLGYNRPVKIFSIVSLLIMLFTLFIMGSRGCILSVIITFPLVSVFIFRHKTFKDIFPLFIIFSFIVLILTALIFSFPNSRYLQRFRHISTIKLTLNPSEMTYNDQIRYDFWRAAMMYAARYPSVFGIGPKNFREMDISKLTFKPPLTETASQIFKNKKVLHAHNWMLTLLVEQGFAGLIFFVIFIITIIVKLIQKKPKNKINAVWVSSFSACFLPCISGLFLSSFSYETGWLTFFVLGLGMWFVHEN